MNNKISIIVPVYRVEDYLRQCLDSILNQTFKDFELILIDDGSPDNSGQICEAYALNDKRIKVVHQENSGLSAARNKGIGIASGDYITFVDSDDMLHERYLEYLFDFIENNDADVSVCGCKKFSYENEINYEYEELNQSIEIRSFTGREAAMNSLDPYGGLEVIACGKLLKKELFDERLFPIGKLNEDLGTMPIVLYNAKTVVVADIPLYYYRQRQGSIMSTAFNARKFDEVDCVEICKNYFEKQDDKDLCEICTKLKETINARLVIEAFYRKSESLIPKKYYMGKFKALKILQRYLNSSDFCWNLNKIMPQALVPYEYYLKITNMLFKRKG